MSLFIVLKNSLAVHLKCSTSTNKYSRLAGIGALGWTQFARKHRNPAGAIPHEFWARPSSGLAIAIFRIRSRISRLIGGRPGPLRRDLNFQNSLKPFRCHRMTVSGLTTINDTCQFLQNRESKIQKRRSRLRSRGRLVDRFIMASCWQSARFSKASA